MSPSRASPMGEWWRNNAQYISATFCVTLEISPTYDRHQSEASTTIMQLWKCFQSKTQRCLGVLSESEVGFSILHYFFTHFNLKMRVMKSNRKVNYTPTVLISNHLSQSRMIFFLNVVIYERGYVSSFLSSNSPPPPLLWKKYRLLLTHAHDNSLLLELPLQMSWLLESTNRRHARLHP